ncbi:MAG: TolC family protein, partial [Candidatus Omnitrophica bacterium]|nr:TolC family protein [Candidatus Omnitrophota bacterium]
LENNFDIQLAKYDTLISRQDEKSARSIYDTVLDAELGYQNDQSQQTSSIFGTKNVTNEYNVGLSQRLPTGTKVRLGIDKKSNATNSVFSTSPVTHDSAFGVSVSQDLGKNFLGIQDRGSIKLTMLAVENTQYTSLEIIEQSITDIQKAYWDLVLAMERVDIENDMLAQSKQLYDLHQRKLKDGLVEPPEAYQSEANYKKRINQLKIAENEVENRRETLKLLLNIDDTRVVIIPTEKLVLDNENLVLSQILKTAVENRRDYKKALNEVKRKDLNLSMKKNNLWPEINLSASLERNGLRDHFDQSIEEAIDKDNPNFMAGLTVEYPIFNSDARAKLKKAEYEKAKQLVYLKFIERKIAMEAVNNLRDRNVLYEVAQNAENIALIHAEKLREEEKRFNKGRSDTDTLVRFQEDLIQARYEAAQAKYQYRLAVIELKNVTGTLLKQYWNEEI